MPAPSVARDPSHRCSRSAASRCTEASCSCCWRPMPEVLHGGWPCRQDPRKPSAQVGVVVQQTVAELGQVATKCSGVEQPMSPSAFLHLSLLACFLITSNTYTCIIHQTLPFFRSELMQANTLFCINSGRKIEGFDVLCVCNHFDVATKAASKRYNASRHCETWDAVNQNDPPSPTHASNVESRSPRLQNSHPPACWCSSASVARRSPNVCCWARRSATAAGRSPVAACP